MIRLFAAPGAFRLLLAAAVVASHLTRFETGRLAVLLFFFLSGYWVSRTWAEKFGRDRLAGFYGARFFRVLPLYWLVLAIVAIATGSSVGLANLLLFGVASSSHDPIGISWSLDVELQFYLLVPIICGLLSSRNRGAILLGASFAIAVAGWAIAATTGIVTVAQYLPAFILGVLGWRFDWRPSDRTAITSLAGFLGVTALLALLPATQPFLDKTAPDPIHRDIFSFFWMLPLLPFVCWSLAMRSTPIDRHLGNLSYPLYLVHYPIVAALAPQAALTKLLAILLSGAAACLIYWLFDRPLDRWRVRMFESRRRERRTVET